MKEWFTDHKPITNEFYIGVFFSVTIKSHEWCKTTIHTFLYNHASCNNCISVFGLINIEIHYLYTKNSAHSGGTESKNSIRWHSIFYLQNIANNTRYCIFDSIKTQWDTATNAKKKLGFSVRFSFTGSLMSLGHLSTKL